MLSAVEDLHMDSHRLLFPEGIHANRDLVNAFAGSLELIAKRAKLPVQTALIETDLRYVSKG